MLWQSSAPRLQKSLSRKGTRMKNYIGLVFSNDNKVQATGWRATAILGAEVYNG